MTARTVKSRKSLFFIMECPLAKFSLRKHSRPSHARTLLCLCYNQARKALGGWAIDSNVLSFHSFPYDRARRLKQIFLWRGLPVLCRALVNLRRAAASWAGCPAEQYTEPPNRARPTAYRSWL